LPQIEDVAQELARLFKKHRIDYMEARLEESSSSRLSYRGRQLENAGRSIDGGGSIRALYKDGWGFVSFNDFSGLEAKVTTAIEQAELAGGRPSKFTAREPITEIVPFNISVNPVSIPLDEKKSLLDEYNELIWQTPKLQTSVIGYGDSNKKTVFVNSEGSFIVQQRADVTLRLSAVAAQNGEIQQSNLSMGSLGDFSAIKNLHKEVARVARHAMELLAAPKVKGGQYTVVLDPVLAGVFTHEAFGHLSESDFLYENPPMKEIMTLGKIFGNEELNIIDSALEPNLRGSYKYDDEGIPSRQNYLIKEGKLVGRLHSRETAAKMGEPPSGNARAVSYRHPPIVRMSNTYIEPRGTTFEQMIGDIKEGIYAKNWYGGTTSMEMFTFSSAEAYMIRNGRIAEAVRPVVLSGNVFDTLKNIDAIGNDLDMNQGGGCGKGSQFPLPVSNGSPHIRIARCLVGGA
jgi:TldD protein